MKALICAISVSLLLCTYSGHAQPGLTIPQIRTAKPRLFDDLPARLLVHLEEVKTIFSLPVGASCNVLVADGFPFKGIVISKSKDDQSYQTIVVQSTNRKGATLTVTRKTNETTTRYAGRIISFKNADAFDITEQNGDYNLVKRNLEELVTE